MSDYQVLSITSAEQKVAFVIGPDDVAHLNRSRFSQLGANWYITELLQLADCWLWGRIFYAKVEPTDVLAIPNGSICTL